MDKEVLEVSLKRVFRESNIQRIIEVETESAVPKGENYASIILRINLKVVLGNGRVAKRSLILKKGKPGEAMKKIAEDFNVFAIEAKMYSVIFKEMEFLMEEFNDQDDPLWCNFIYYDPVNLLIVLQDLKAIGFKLVERQKGLDLEHGLLVLRNMGRYHGMAKILEERGVISTTDYKPFVFLTNDYYIKLFTYSAAKSGATGIKKYWGPKWATVADKLCVPYEVFLEKTKNCAKHEEEIFTCLNHGDCWTNNMMFKYDWKNRPVSVRFVDYQGPHYSTPCVDLTNFIYMSIQPKIRRQNYKLLLQCYHDSLSSTLDKFGFGGTKPSLEEIERVMGRLKFLGLSYFASFYAVVTCKSTEAFDLDKVCETNGESGYNIEIYNEEGMIERLGPDLIDFAEMLSAH